MKLYQVDAFTDEVFSGNPAAVIPIESWLDEEVMQRISAENNLSETAYFVKKSDGSYHIRWFTPCLLYTSPSPRDLSTSRMPSSA